MIFRNAYFWVGLPVRAALSLFAYAWCSGLWLGTRALRCICEGDVYEWDTRALRCWVAGHRLIRYRVKYRWDSPLHRCTRCREYFHDIPKDHPVVGEEDSA